MKKPIQAQRLINKFVTPLFTTKIIIPKKLLALPAAVMVLLLLALLMVACNLIEFIDHKPDSSPDQSSIVFVTATPAKPDLPLAENQRSTVVITATAIPTPQPYFADANEMGQILVLEYHRITYPEDRYQRSPVNFRADLQRLYQSGYYPVNFIDLIDGLPDVPPGKKPIVLTFDDSHISQFDVLPDHSINADSAVGIMLNFHNLYPQDWPARATFFVLGDDTANHIALFGQPTWAKSKIQFLVDIGMEIGSHTVNHSDLSVATEERIQWELAVSKHVIEEMAPGYVVQTMSVPYGGFPYTLEFLKSGVWGDYYYTYAGNAAAWGGSTVSPFDANFEPYHISRVEVTGASIDSWLTYFDKNPHEYYTSDGDPKRITVPQPKVAVGNE